LLAGEIPRNLAHYTVHDITHLDALWGLCDIIAGPSITLTPPEAFILGGSILCHDLGMSASAYVGGLTDVEASPLFAEGIAVLCFTADALSEAQREAAVAWVLRENHAIQRGLLPTQGWRDTRTGESLYLIEDAELRKTFGVLIGQLAASHWWSFERVASQLSRILGAALDFPHDWSVDVLKIAALLRLSDAAHIDARRAPTFLRAIRGIHGPSELHWLFQECILQPRLVVDRLEYSAATPIGIAHAPAWWLAFDAINMIDNELAAVDSYLSADPSRVRFAARGVVGAHNSTALARLIPTAGWMPLNAQPQISDVAALIDKLGGKELYGNNPSIAIRELLQNASDAIRAVQAIRGGTLATDRIHLALDTHTAALQVVDTGVGMSVDTIRDVLLNFGVSGWRADLVRRDLPDLLRTKFRATGKYGIGFFSIFMLGQRVTVATRRFDGAARDTIVLEFMNGLWERPLLREASLSERMLTPGTKISVSLDSDVLENLLSPILEDPRFADVALNKLVETLAPGSVVPIDVDQDGTVSTVLDGRPIAELTEEELFERIKLPTNPRWELREMEYQRSSNITSNSGEWLGRAALARSHRSVFVSEACIVVSDGGIRGGTIEGLVGIVRGEPLRATRDVARPIGDVSAYSRWATEQCQLLKEFDVSGSAQTHAALTAIALGGDPGPLALVESKDGFLDKSALAAWIAARRRFVLVSDSPISGLRYDRYHSSRIALEVDVLAIDQSPRFFIVNALTGTVDAWPNRRLMGMSEYVMTLAAELWDVPVESIIVQGDINAYYSKVQYHVATFDDGREVVEPVAIVMYPGGI
jgi:hypothetical protein